MTVGGVLGQALGLYQRFFWRFAAVTAVVMVFLSLIAAIGTLSEGDDERALWRLLTGVLTLVGVFLVQGALTLAVADVRDGRVDRSIGQLYARTFPHLGALLIAVILATIGITLGLILLIAPGLYLLTRWVLIVPAVVLEGRKAGESFTRSNELTSGHRWTVLGVVFVTWLASVVIGNLVVTLLTRVLPDFFGVWLGNVVADCVTIPFLALAWTVMYFELSREEEPAAELESAAA